MSFFQIATAVAFLYTGWKTLWAIDTLIVFRRYRNQHPLFLLGADFALSSLLGWLACWGVSSIGFWLFF